MIEISLELIRLDSALEAVATSRSRRADVKAIKAPWPASRCQALDPPSGEKRTAAPPQSPA